MPSQDDADQFRMMLLLNKGHSILKAARPLSLTASQFVGDTTLFEEESETYQGGIRNPDDAKLETLAEHIEKILSFYAKSHMSLGEVGVRR